MPGSKSGWLANGNRLLCVKLISWLATCECFLGALFDLRAYTEIFNTPTSLARSGGFFIGCSLNVAKATTMPSLRDRNEGGAVCLPAVAIYSAGFRKVRKEATHIVK